MDRPRALFVLHVPPPVHGAAVMGQLVCESAAVNDAFDCRFVNLSTSHTAQEVGRRPLVKIARSLGVLARVRRELRDFRPHLCYVTPSAGGRAFVRDAIVGTMARRAGARVIYHLHSKGVALRRGPLDARLYRDAFRDAHIVLLSPRLYPDVSAYVTEERVRYCPNGLPDAPVPIRTPRDGPVEILFLSNLIESKGPLVLLEAIRRLRGDGFRCTIGGADGDLAAATVRELADRMGLRDVVTVPGPLHGQAKADALARADMLAFPTFYRAETFGLVNVEAMRAGLPVVTTDEGGIPDVVEDGATGLIVPRKDPVALSDAILRLVRDPKLRRRMGTAGRARYERLFTLRAFEERLVGILREVAGR